MSNTEARLEKLEQSLRLWRRAGIGLGLGLALVLAAAVGLQPVQADEDLPFIDASTVKARYIQLVNDDGKTVVAIEASQSGNGLVTIKNATTYSGVQISSDETGYVQVIAEDGSNRAFQP